MNIPRWLVDIAESQAILVAAIIGGVCAILAALVRDRFKTFVWILSIIAITGAAALLILFVRQSSEEVLEQVRKSPETPPIAPGPEAKSGLVDFEQKVELLYDDRIRLLDQTQRDVLFVGVTLYRAPQETKNGILSAYRRGVRVRMLVADPNGSFYAANAAMFGQTVEQLRQETLATIEGYRLIDTEARQLQNPALGDPQFGTFELRLIDRVFPNAFYFYDPSPTGGDLIMVARSFELNSPEMPGFYFRFVKGGAFEVYLRSALSLWEKATPHKEWKDVAH